MIATGGIFGARLGGANESFGGGLLFKYNPGTGMVPGMVLNKDGNVGIGKTNPGVALDVVGATNISGNLGVGGNVGIGTANPGAKLHVNGDISAGQPGNLGTRMNGGYVAAVKDIWHSTGTNLNGFNGGGTVLFFISGNYSGGSAVVSYAYIVHKMFSGAETQPLQFALLSKFEADGGTGLNRHIQIRVNPANGNLEFRARNTGMNIQFTTLESR
jgi:hypothetical protein